jgi:hypothetical protein
MSSQVFASLGLLGALALPLLDSSPAMALEGKWLPEQVLELDRAMLRREGLELPPERLWDPARGTGLLAGAVNLNGCSGAFISATGLVVTNHHCVFSMVAEHATPDRDLIREGFLARSRAEELPSKAARLRIPKAFIEVTARVNGAVAAGADDLQRFQAIDRVTKEIVKECEAQPATRCDVASHWGGLKYVLMVQAELRDVRLVYAPPRAVGEFGGEIDNWMWPRHTGDVAIVRAYVGAPGAGDGAPAPSAPESVPFKPEFFFPLSEEGVKAGDFVMVLGYPGFSVREQLHEEMALRAQRLYPALADLQAELITILEAVEDPAGKIAVASQLKSLHNRKKNALGQIAGIARGRILEKKAAADAAVVAFAAKDAQRTPALAARDELLRELEQRQAAFERELLLTQVHAGARALSLATLVARMAAEREKPDLERDPAFMERERQRLLDQLEREQKSLFPPADKKLLLAFVKRAQRLPEAHRITAVDILFGRAAPERALEKKIDDLYKRSKLLTLQERQKMTAEDVRQLKKRGDPLLTLGFAMNEELDRQKREDDRRAGASTRLRPLWLKAELAAAGRPVAPDANRTLRVSFARVRGYRPRDGVTYLPHTTLRGVLDKGTGEEPFVVPERVRLAFEKGDWGRWRDKLLGEVPVNFLADADTTGGNSGSPVVNGKGQLVGVNFDRVWENVANDFGYNPEVARNVNVDVRYLLWLLDRVEGAAELLQELGVRR